MEQLACNQRINKYLYREEASSHTFYLISNLRNRCAGMRADFASNFIAFLKRNSLLCINLQNIAQNEVPHRNPEFRPAYW